MFGATGLGGATSLSWGPCAVSTATVPGSLGSAVWGPLPHGGPCPTTPQPRGLLGGGPCPVDRAAPSLPTHQPPAAGPRSLLKASPGWAVGPTSAGRSAARWFIGAVGTANTAPHRPGQGGNPRWHHQAPEKPEADRRPRPGAVRSPALGRASRRGQSRGWAPQSGTNLPSTGCDALGTSVMWAELCPRKVR